MTESAVTVIPSNRVGRQTCFVASVMVLLGLGLGVYVNRWWLLLALMPGIGMMITALSGFCPMSWILARMPWNGPGRSGKCRGG